MHLFALLSAKEHSTNEFLYFCCFIGKISMGVFCVWIGAYVVSSGKSKTTCVILTVHFFSHDIYYQWLISHLPGWFHIDETLVLLCGAIRGQEVRLPFLRVVAFFSFFVFGSAFM